MSVASKNPFALLNEDEDDSRNAAPAKKNDKPAEAANLNPKLKANQKQTSTRGGRYYQRGGGPKTTPMSPPVETTDPTSAPGEKKGYRGDRGDRPPRGDRGERGRGRGGRGRGRGGDRPDRHSATGIVDSHKKVHQGWGGDRGDTELKDETAGANDAAAGDAWGAPATTEGWDATAPTGEGWGAPANGGGDAPADPWADSAGGVESKDKAGDDEGRKRKKYDDEEDEGKMTLDEYRAKSAPAESETIPKLELRKANEGASDLFEGARQLVKDVDADNYFVGKQSKSGGGPKTRKESKQYIEIETRFEPPARARGRGRGRGEYRGGRDGGGRNDRRGGGRYQSQQAVNVEDPNAFPALA